ncbi:MAG: hypothetical protein R3E01_05000 [Pirellulaceae bacterium]|nr:hypothetical protein [Planctomycetales bacterium]
MTIPSCLCRPVVCLLAAASVWALMLTWAAPSNAAVTLTSDPEYPAFPDVFTLDPELFAPAQRGLANTRALRQTFQSDSTFTVGEIIIGIASQGNPGGININVYEVDDVLAETWTPGNLVKNIVVPEGDPIPTSTARLGFTLSESDLFELPARNTDATGYGIEFSVVDQTSTIGLLRHSNSGEDGYLNGVFYTESGGQSSPTRDLGIALIGTNALVPLDGDVNGDRAVTMADFDIINNNFRNSVTSRSQGDLTGDRFVNFDDFRQWKSNFAGAVPAASSVPEPASAVLVVLGILLWGCHGRRSR